MSAWLCAEAGFASSKHSPQTAQSVCRFQLSISEPSWPALRLMLSSFCTAVPRHVLPLLLAGALGDCSASVQGLSEFLRSDEGINMRDALGTYVEFAIKLADIILADYALPAPPVDGAATPTPFLPLIREGTKPTGAGR